MNLTVMILLLSGLVVSATVCIFLRDLLQASIAMAVVSAILSVIMFVMGAPLAAVFELSVCAGLITVIFISAISMTRIRTKEEITRLQKIRRKRFAPLPVILISLLTIAVVLLWPRLDDFLPSAFEPVSNETVQQVFWNDRLADVLGQIVIILAGVFGVLIFFKEGDAK